VTVSPLKRALGRVLVFVLVPLALVLVAVPFVHLARSDDWGIIDDTRAYFGAGTAEGAPKVTQVTCIKQSYGTSRRGHAEWACTLYLAYAQEEPAPIDWKKDYDAAFAQWVEQTNARMKALLTDPHAPGKLERILAFDRSGDLPTLRRLSTKGEPPRFGAVWSGRELAVRWFFCLLLFAIFLTLGVLCLLAARVLWRR
jgi:hypothetical protein